MTDEPAEQNPAAHSVKAVKKTAKDRGFSPVWIIPIVAVVIGLFLIYRVFSEAGPTINVTFQEGAGLEAGKTKVKFKDVEVGQVSNVMISPDMASVIVTMDMDKGMKPYMREKTQFWVVKPRVSAGSISGLGTILSGAYIGMDPAKDGGETKKFIGLERPPVVQSDVPGTNYNLRADRLGGVEIGVPVYYKQIRAGQVIDYALQDDGTIRIEVFVKRPYDAYVSEATRFWNASGVDASLSVEGLEIRTESLVAVLGGGVAFDTARGLGLDATKKVDEQHVFQLYASEAASQQRSYSQKNQWLLYFDDPIRGLLPGAPVELRGYKIGQVLDIKFEFDTDTSEFRIPVLIEIEPERISVVGNRERVQPTNEQLVERGLRAKLKMGNLLLGKLLVDMDFYPDAPKAVIDYSQGTPIFPTVKGELGALLEDARALIAELRLAGDKMNELLASQEFQTGVQNVTETLGHIKNISAQLDEEAAPEIAEVLAEVAATLSEARAMFAAESTTRAEISQLMIELAAAAQSVRELTDYLEQNPESIIRGKDK